LRFLIEIIDWSTAAVSQHVAHTRNFNECAQLNELIAFLELNLFAVNQFCKKLRSGRQNAVRSTALLKNENQLIVSNETTVAVPQHVFVP
jgi:hypothetical protein